VEIEIRSVAFAGNLCRARIPFRFGKVTLEAAPVAIARVEIRANGALAVGHSGDLCVPKWFEKDAAKSTADDVRALFASAERAALAYRGAAGTAFAIWQAAHARCTVGDLASGVPLVDGFGVALVERALLDAACRARGSSFREALEANSFGFEPGALLPETRSLDAGTLVAAPAASVLVRHTVGGLDPLRRADVSAQMRGNDDHPVSLEEDIARYGLRAFKLKAGGEPATDALRLAEIARVVAEHAAQDPIFTLDANESYTDTAQVGKLLELLGADPDGRSILEHLAYIEQPLPRARTLDPATRDDVLALAQSVPLLIDEADDSIDAFQRALDIGYRGVSVKNCKGVFRALANRALCMTRGGDTFQTSEDLTNLPVLPLQQDLATLAALGLPHSERNGHHYFAGLDVVPRAEAESALAKHPDLYERRGDRIVLKIRDGAVSLACQNARGYGYDATIAWDARMPLAELTAELPS
jgi:hypothetical protein